MEIQKLMTNQSHFVQVLRHSTKHNRYQMARITIQKLS